MNALRAKALIRLHNWQNGGCLNMDNPRPEVQEETPDEAKMIDLIWRSMSGGSCRMDVLYEIANGRVLTTMVGNALKHHINQPNNGLG